VRITFADVAGPQQARLLAEQIKVESIREIPLSGNDIETYPIQR
jgi:hypothetical protein